MRNWLAYFKSDYKRKGNLLLFGFTEGDIRRADAKMELLLTGNQFFVQDLTDMISEKWYLNKMDSCIDKHHYSRSALYELANYMWLYENSDNVTCLERYQIYFHMCVKYCNSHNTPYVY